MSATQKPAGSDSDSDSDDARDGQVTPVPDEDGPHDVPDETVIEKTLPTAPNPRRRGGGGQ